MKKKIIFCILAILCVALTCFPIYRHVNNNGNIELIIKEGTVSNEGMILILHNGTKYTYEHGNLHTWCFLEKKIDNEWVTLKSKIEIADTLMPHFIKPQTKKEIVLKWKERYGSLQKGEYRIATIVNKENEPDNLLKIYAEFSID